MYDGMGHAFKGANGRYALGLALTQSGRLSEATECLQQALRVFRDSRQRLWEGMTLFRLAELDLTARRPAQAASNAEMALTLLRGIGGDWRCGNVLTVLGRALHGIGQHGRAQVCWREALDLFEALGAPEADEVRGLLKPVSVA
jgi:tetratricopeptide (TPR) repeat protein